MGLEIDNSKMEKILLGKYEEAKEEYIDRKNLAEITSNIKSSTERYSDQKLIAEGGMKRIYRVYDQLTDRTLALARPKNEECENFKEYFLREARITASLQHPNIMPVHDIGCNDKEEVFFTMTLIEGKNLAELLFNEKQNISIDTLHNYLGIFLKVCDAISHAHDKGVVHLDLKPANIQVGDHGDVLLCDWGVSKILFHECEEEILFKKDLEIASLNMTLANRGTPGYMAPEQFTKEKTDKQTDIYALGGVLYSILTGKHPLQKGSLSDMEKATLGGDILSPSKSSPERFIPVSLEAICMKALKVEKKNRYHSVQELKKEIQAYLNGFATEAENASFSTQTKLFVKRNKRIVSVIAAALALILIGTFYFILELSKKEKATQKALKQSVNSELETKSALARLQKEKDSRIEAQKLTAQRFTKEAITFLRVSNFPKALAGVEKALQHDPDSAEATRVKVRVSLALHEFEDALKASQKIPEDRFQIIHQTCARAVDSLENGKATIETLLIVSRYFKPVANDIEHSLYQSVLEKNYQALHGNDKKIYIKKLICSLNNELTLNDIKIDLEKRSLTINSPHLVSMPYLKGSHLRHIDLSHSGVLTTEFCSFAKIQSLDLSYSKVKNFNGSDTGKVANLNISNINKIGFPRKISNVEFFNIAGTQMNDYSRLLNLRNLKELTVKKGQVPVEIIKLLKCEVIEID